VSAPTVPTPESARADLDLVRGLVARAEMRIDPHAFHFVHWGLIVLVWYPLANVFERMGKTGWMVALGVASLALGIVLSVVREVRPRAGHRLAGENAFISRQVVWITAANIVGAVILSVLLPALGVLDGHHAPVVWGLAYANLAFMVGVVYRKEFLVSGCLIFAASLLALALPGWNGVVLGPAMGLGLAVPGWMAERRVRRLREEGGDEG
jgi:hypothetical protein